MTCSSTTNSYPSGSTRPVARRPGKPIDVAPAVVGYSRSSRVVRLASPCSPRISSRSTCAVVDVASRRASPRPSGRMPSGRRASTFSMDVGSVPSMHLAHSSSHRPIETLRRAPVFVVLALLLAACFTTGCFDPDRELLARLGEADEERFLRGRRVATPCWTCHDLAGTVKKVGPSLLGLYGRPSGRAPDYNGSPAMISASIVWDDRSLSAFLSNPAGFVPGNRMVSPAVPPEAGLADLVFYLRHVTRPGARSPE